MYRVGTVGALTLLSACQYAFGVPVPDALPSDAAGSDHPLQQAVAAKDAADVTPLVVSFANPTTEGSTLVLAVGLRTNTENVSTITDDAANVWVRALDGLDSPDTGTTATRVEIWFAPAAHPTTTLTIERTGPRTTAVNATEWAGIAPAATVLGRSTARSDSSDLVTTGEIALPAPALLLGTVAFDDRASPALQTIGFLPLLSVETVTSPDLYLTTTYALAPAGTGDLQWTISPPTRWSSALVGLRRK